MTFERKNIAILRNRLNEKLGYIIVVSGPRQIGKSTLVKQAISGHYSSMFIATDRPAAYSLEDNSLLPTALLPGEYTEDGNLPPLPGTQPNVEWLANQWMLARAKTKALPEGERHILVIDEIQKIPQWSETVKGNTITERFENFYDNKLGLEAEKSAKVGFQQCVFREDLPTVPEIITIYTARKGHLIQLSCLIGMELLWQEGKVKDLSKDILKRMIAFQLTWVADKIPDWFIYLARNQPILVAEIFVEYASASLKTKLDFLNLISLISSNIEYKGVSMIAAPALLKKFPVRAKKIQLNYLNHFLKATLCHTPEELPAIIETKITKKGMNAAQKINWLAISILLNPKKNQKALWEYVGKKKSRINCLAQFLADFKTDDYPLSVNMLGKLIELMALYAEGDPPADAGWADDTMRLSQQVRSLITQLGALSTDEAAQELDRLLALNRLKNIRNILQYVRNQQRTR